MLHSKSFTLIELLTATAIISILAALLLPALGKAKARAKAAQCINNEKQCLLAVISYSDDNKSTFPRRTLSAEYPWSADLGWATLLFREKYLPGNYDIILCPSLPPDGTGTQSVSAIKNVNVCKVSYGLFRILSAGNRLLPYEHEVNGQNYVIIDFRRIRNPSGTMVGGDSYQGTSSIWGLNGAQTPTIYLDRTDEWHSNVHARHNGQMNMMFTDGHVSALPPREYRRIMIEGDTKYTRTTLRYYPESTTPFPVPINL